LLREWAGLEKKNAGTMTLRIRGLLEKESIEKLFDFGCFLEHTLLSTFAGKNPRPGDIEKYRPILLHHQNQLAPGVCKELDKLKPTSSLEDTQAIFSALAEIFLSLE
jgi:hypothetical protein